jgi:hypothetical protein
MSSKATAKATTKGTRNRISKADLEVMVEEATVDAYGESEQATAWLTALEEHLALPFDTRILGSTVKVTKLDLRGDEEIVAVCTRGRERQTIGVLDVPLPSPRPAGFEWLEAYRYWRGGR